jgi:DeoR/GlpR family transcriptional regulator of sugar metabolism
MMTCGQEVLIAADHSKFGRQSLSRLCGLDEIQRVVTDSGIADSDRAMLESAGVELILAPIEPGSDGSNGSARNHGSRTQPR